MGEGYGTLRLWSTVLMFVGVLGVIFVVIGTIFAVFAASSFWQGVAFLLIGGPLRYSSPAGRSRWGKA